jgi:serine/threonine-protein kinase
VSELLHLQTRILREISQALEVPHSKREAESPAQSVTANPDAYRAYLQGRHSWNQRSEEGLRQAMERFQLATEIDPRFAAAHSGLADCYVATAKASYTPPSEAFPAAERHATRALELDPLLCEPYASLGFVKLYYEWDWPAAEAEFQRAIALDPNYAVSHEWYSVFLLTAGRRTEAAREIQLAHRLDPLSIPINCTVGFHQYYTAQYEEAAKQLKFVLEMSKDFPPAHLWLGRSYQELGRFEKAAEEFRWVGERARQWPVLVAARGFMAGATGRTQEARDSLAELKGLASHRFVTAYSVALVHAGLGDDESAFEWLNRAFDERSNWLIWLRLDPRWKRLRSDARFEELVERIGFPPPIEQHRQA